jgi:hypothetical protein
MVHPTGKHAAGVVEGGRVGEPGPGAVGGEGGEHLEEVATTGTIRDDPGRSGAALRSAHGVSVRASNEIGERWRIRNLLRMRAKFLCGCGLNDKNDP